MKKEREEKLLKVPNDRMCSCFHFETKKLDLYHLSKCEFERIYSGLELLQKRKLKDKIISRMLKEYSKYLKCFVKK